MCDCELNRTTFCCYWYYLSVLTEISRYYCRDVWNVVLSMCADIVCFAQATDERVGARTNHSDLDSQLFYRVIEKTYSLHIAAMFAALYMFGGFPAVIWGGALRLVIVYHITWFVNSASHVWGNQAYNTGDLSR